MLFVDSESNREVKSLISRKVDFLGSSVVCVGEVPANSQMAVGKLRV